MTRLTQSVALACGTAGAFVDVSSYANLLEPTSRAWGRQSEFEDTAPGTFSFTLDNGDGRFNPGSTLLATPVTEGMQVCWGLGSRLTAGTILAIEPTFPDAESAWAQVTITCDDMLGNAARHAPESASELVLGAVPYLWWRFDDPVGYTAATDTTRASRGSLTRSSGTITFGSTGVSGLGFTQMTGTDSGSGADLSWTVGDSGVPPVTLAYSSVTDLGWWTVPLTHLSSAGNIYFIVSYSSMPITSGGKSFTFGPQGDIYVGGDDAPKYAFFQVLGGGSVSGPEVYIGAPNIYSVHVTTETAAGTTTLYATPYLDGVALSARVTMGSYAGVAPTRAQASPTGVAVNLASASPPSSYSVSTISLTVNPVPLQVLTAATTTTQRLTDLATIAPEITLDTPPTISTILGGQDATGRSILDSLNDVIRAVQGAIYSTTTGTLTAPVEKVTVRARDRVAAVTYSFNVETEASGGTDFIRDITNMAQSVTVDGPTQSATYTDTTLESRVGSKNVSEEVPLRDYIDLYTWGTDRVFRGANVALRAASVTIDALTTPTNRTADLLALVPGDRIQLTGLPTSLGFTTWDGWLLGVEETHSLTEHTFTLYLQPVLPRPVILTTDLLTAGDAVTLTSNINSAVTSISLTSTGGLWTTGADLPQVIRIGSECMTLSAVSGASSPQTGTVARAATDPLTGLATTAAAHTAGDAIELASYGVLAF